MKEIETLKWMGKCPRFSWCDVPKCPLDPHMNKRVAYPGEPKCTLAKSIRYRLGEGLPYHGLTKAEWTAKKRWEEKPEEEKQRIIERGKRALATLKDREKRATLVKK